MRDNKGVPFTDLKKKRREKNLNIIEYQVICKECNIQDLANTKAR